MPNAKLFFVWKVLFALRTCDFDSILWHCTKLFMRQRIDCEQIFDVTFENPPLKNPAYATGLRHVLQPVLGKLMRNVNFVQS